MTKEQFKTKYSKARALVSAIGEFRSSKNYKVDRGLSQSMYDSAFDSIRKDPQVYYAIVNRFDDKPYKLSCDSKWVVRYNSRAFSRSQPRRESKMKWRQAA